MNIIELDADYIYAMRNDEVVESVTYEEVCAQDIVYKEIFDASNQSMNIDKIVRTLDGDDN